MGVEVIVEGCTKLEAFDVSQCKNLSRWLESGGMHKFSDRVRFDTVAGRSKIR